MYLSPAELDFRETAAIELFLGFLVVVHAGHCHALRTRLRGTRPHSRPYRATTTGPVYGTCAGIHQHFEYYATLPTADPELLYIAPGQITLALRAGRAKSEAKRGWVLSSTALCHCPARQFVMGLT